MSNDRPAEHLCRECGRCDCSGCERPCAFTCGWDCGCPDYPPPETWDVTS